MGVLSVLRRTDLAYRSFWPASRYGSLPVAHTRVSSRCVPGGSIEAQTDAWSWPGQYRELQRQISPAADAQLN
jgi:hypothetical protein